MAQVTMLGLNTDNVVTILTPSSTIEAPLISAMSDNTTGSSGSLTIGTPIQLQLPSTNLYIVYGTITVTAPTVATISVSIGTFIWSQKVEAGVVNVPFQTICRVPVSLLVTGFAGSATYAYTATTLR